ncbi:hypothetical protein [Olleya sp. ITB9]|uniref:hypothetical protein n=1 Tax=Olleya sp. ITB9 TaxID=1715648 RepID=UPI0006D05BCB|nr:hypothetical protein [Olleya sp. ITB9]
MEYKFKKYDISSPNIKNKTYSFGIDYDTLRQEEETLFEINSHAWTPQSIQELIETCTNVEGENTIDYQVDHGNLGLIIDKDEVAFFNLLESEKETEDFTWSIDKFINFLNDFKKFVEQNS